MKTQLKLHEKWVKALSPEGKAEILNNYLKRSVSRDEGVVYSPLKTAVNHQGSLLVTVFIENRTSMPWKMNHSMICTYRGKKLAAATFMDSSITVDPFTLMPWTFIFPKNQIVMGTEAGSLSTNELRVSEADEEHDAAAGN